MRTYPEMDKEIIKLLDMEGMPLSVYAARCIEKLQAENAELRERLDRAVELPLVQTIRGNKLPYEVAYKDGNGRIIVTKYRRWQKKQAEARLKELQGGER